MKLTYRETSQICQGLSLLLHAGIPLSDGAHLLAREENQGSVLQQIGDALDQGIPLSEAMTEAGGFPPYVPAMIAIGEASGKTEIVLSSLGEYYHRREATRRLVRNTLSYPCMLLALMLMVICLLLTEVLPVFNRVYLSLGTGLTGVSLALLRLGQGLRRAMPVILALLILGGLSALILLRSPTRREQLAASLRRRTGDRGIQKRFNNARFLQAMALALGSGITPEEGLELTRTLLAGDPRAMERWGLCKKTMEAGASLPQAMEQAEFLTPAQSRMLSVGLRSGSGDTVMQQLALQQSEDAETALETAVARLEPILVAVCSALVGLILLSVMLPLASLLSGLG